MAKRKNEIQAYDFFIDDSVRFHFDVSNSHVHGFDENPLNIPVSWDHYYKEYLSFSIFYRDTLAENIPENWEMIFSEDSDECSCLLYVNIILYSWLKDHGREATHTCLTVTDKTMEKPLRDFYSLNPLGDGASWDMRREPVERNVYDESTDSPKEDSNHEYIVINDYRYTFWISHSYGAPTGVKIILFEDELVEFNKVVTRYLNTCMENAEVI